VDYADAIVAEAKSWVGTPYVPRALVKGVGVDCGGLLYKVYEPFFGPFENFPQDYSSDWALHVNNERYLDFIMPYVKPAPAPVRGGFSVFHFGLNYSHGAIFIGDDSYVHAWGRQRQGRVAQQKRRVLMNIGDSRAFPPKHFEPI
jgi:cell wall-associated NlpC family hydrolase